MHAAKDTTELTVEAWLAQREWHPFDFQREAWAHIAAGRSGLLHASTGSGKTYAVWLGVLQALLDSLPRSKSAPLSVIWLTPMRALAADTARALQTPLQELAPAWTLGLRTGDTPSGERAKQDRRMPTVLITTPESLTLLISREKCAEELSSVRYVIADEWHELLGNKRGVQTQLALARLCAFNPKLVTWGLSATLSNKEHSAQVLCRQSAKKASKFTEKSVNQTVIVQGKQVKDLRIDTLIPDKPGNYSWAGHLGARMLEPVVKEIESSGTTLVFTNTRSQAEIWYQLILEAKPEWAGLIALHHGSLDKEVRDWVEQGLKAGRLLAVVATSSLDLGVDFLPVERVLQIGSAKGVARLIQRAGRSGHAPGRTSRITLVPTNTLELIEAAAARRAAQAGQIESRASPYKPLDVLVQHIVTVALGGGFTADALYEEVRSAFAYQDLSREEFNWALAFCERGGDSLAAYPDYHRIKPDENGIYRVPDRAVARRHRLNIGTIVSDAAMQVKYQTGQRIGTIEESFIARLKKGDCFTFAGRILELIRVNDMTAYVKRAEKNKASVPSWQGGKMPLSSELADNVVSLLAEASDGYFHEPEMQAAEPMLATQMRLSRMPRPGSLLIESYTSKEGHHLYIYPFAGRNVHLGLASLLAYRLALDEPATFSLSVNDYGFELLSATACDMSKLQDQSLFASKDLLQDVLASLNSSELAQRRFREIARIAGLIFTGYPGAAKSNKQLQASSGLFFEVFKKYDERNMLLVQAQQEVLSQELNIEQLQSTLQAMQKNRLDWVQLSHPSPLSLPLMVERLREKLSTEKLADRLDRILRDAEKI
ncbi:ligase-associated DNA damage response DEXH box helicase [Variovorax sp. PCZ-1]|uniref:ligase-associated DNA damage response DEXH box helicase n=1 Tax=Variovorax sp. PCZ-1 TaxID=2835533 RepID=UPI001BD0CB88|nr:ligase-associated DNA damage response DEXH box helicase [Variovorax sp. PCZ-1]MBS7806401.1 ligase-associated DNA damage response DEXH box helicase [Variovorax sp. PCZ-1]